MKTDNELIAEFMKLDKHPNNQRAYWIEDQDCYLTFDNLQFHKSWNQLMPVVEKIHKVQPRAFKRDLFTGPLSPLAELYITSSIGAVYKAVVEFIKWYNVSKDKTTEL